MENFFDNRSTIESRRDNGKFRGTNDSQVNNDCLTNLVAMDSHGNRNKNEEERENRREDTDEEARQHHKPHRQLQPQSSFSEEEEKSLLQLKRALFKHDQINEVPGEIF